MSDTPRTDAMEEQLGKTDCCFVIEPEFPTLIGFARQLERELAFVRKELSEAREMEMMKAQQCTAERLRANAAEEKLRRG